MNISDEELSRLKNYLAEFMLDGKLIKPLNNDCAGNCEGNYTCEAFVLY